MFRNLKKFLVLSFFVLLFMFVIWATLNNFTVDSSQPGKFLNKGIVSAGMLDSINVIKNDTLKDELRKSNSTETKVGITKEHISDEKRIVITDDKNITLLNLQLESDYEVAVVGWNDMDLIAWFFLEDYSGTNLVDNVKFYDVNNNYAELNKNFTFKYKTRVNVSGCDDFGKNCEMFEDDNWTIFNSLSELPSKNMKIGLFTDINFGDKIEWVINKDGFDFLEWALAEGTNVGFVTTAPTSDPTGAGTRIVDNRVRGTKFTSHADATKLTELGWYKESGTATPDFEIGIYDHDAGNNAPGNLLASSTAATGSSAGWQTQTFDLVISGSTIYWLEVQVDDSTAVRIDVEGSVSGALTNVLGQPQTALQDPWPGGEATTADELVAIYALYTSDTCSCPTVNTDWEVNMVDNCELNTACNLGTGTLNFTGSGYANCTANINTTNMGDPGSSGILYVSNGCSIQVS